MEDFSPHDYFFMLSFILLNSFITIFSFIKILHEDEVRMQEFYKVCFSWTVA